MLALRRRFFFGRTGGSPRNDRRPVPRLTSMIRSVALLGCSICLSAGNFAPADVAILGDIDYGGKSRELSCEAKPPYCALLFNGTTGDRVEATVSGGDGKAFVAIADGSLKELVRGSGSVTATLPDVQDGLATYYILFRDPQGKAGRFTVELKKKQS
jgi:hypothetical protein